MITADAMAGSSCQVSLLTGSQNRLELMWAPDNPDEVDRNNHVALLIVNGSGPFTWSVAGTDFWFDAAHTQTSMVTRQTNEADLPGNPREIELYAGSAACGTAAIVVTDKTGAVTGGEVRCSAGYWLVVSTNEALAAGNWQWVTYGPEYYLIKGKYKVRQSTRQTPYNHQIDGQPLCDQGYSLTGCPDQISCQNPLEVACEDWGELWSLGVWPDCHHESGGENHRCTESITTWEWLCQ